MTDSDECIHGLTLETCTICLKPTQAVGAIYPSSHSVTAKFDGACPGCDGGPIYAGDEIYYDGTGWCHVGC